MLILQQADRFKWTGREYHAETGLQYNRARYYLNATGRWLSEDPIRWQAGDVNLYRYVNNASTSYTDPSGNDESGIGGGEGIGEGGARCPNHRALTPNAVAGLSGTPDDPAY